MRHANDGEGAELIRAFLIVCLLVGVLIGGVALLKGGGAVPTTQWPVPGETITCSLVLEPSAVDGVPMIGPVRLGTAAFGPRGSQVRTVIGDLRSDSVFFVHSPTEGITSVDVMNGVDVLRHEVPDVSGGVGFGRSVATVSDKLIVVGGSTYSPVTGRWDRGGVSVFDLNGDSPELIQYMSISEIKLLTLGVWGGRHLAFAYVSVEPGGNRVFFGINVQRFGGDVPGGILEGVITDDGIRFVNTWAGREMELDDYRLVGANLAVCSHPDEGTVGLCLWLRRAHEFLDDVAYVTLSEDGPVFKGLFPRAHDVEFFGAPCRVPDVTGDGVDDVLVGASKPGPSSFLSNYSSSRPTPRESFIFVYDIASGIPQLVKVVAFGAFVDETGERLPVCGAPSLAVDHDQRHILFSAGDRQAIYARTEERRASDRDAVWRVPLDVFRVD